MSLQSKSVIITGAGSGLGAAITHLFVQQGANVVITGRRESALQATAAKENALGKGRVLPVVADVANAGDWQRVVAQSVSHFGGVDVLINNAGWEGPTISDLRTVSVEDVRKIFDTNVIGSLLGTKFAVDELIKRKGTIITVSSVASVSQRNSAAAFALYATTKVAADAVTRQLHGLYNGLGVKTFGINPGAYSSDMADRVQKFEGLAASGVKDAEGLAAMFNPLSNLGDPADVAVLARNLATGSHKYQSGDCIIVFPGETVGHPFTFEVAHMLLAQASPVPGAMLMALAEMPLQDATGTPIPAAQAAVLRAKIKANYANVLSSMAAAAAPVAAAPS